MNQNDKPSILLLRNLVIHPQLAHPQLNCTNYQLTTDKSNYAVSAALHQILEGNPIPVRFFSKKLTQVLKVILPLIRNF